MLDPARTQTVALSCLFFIQDLFCFLVLFQKSIWFHKLLTSEFVVSCHWLHRSKKKLPASLYTEPFGKKCPKSENHIFPTRSNTVLQQVVLKFRKFFFFKPNDETMRNFKCMTGLCYVMGVGLIFQMKNISFSVLSFEKIIWNSAQSDTILTAW